MTGGGQWAASGPYIQETGQRRVNDDRRMTGDRQRTTGSQDNPDIQTPRPTTLRRSVSAAAHKVFRRTLGNPEYNSYLYSSILTKQTDMHPNVLLCSALFPGLAASAQSAAQNPRPEQARRPNVLFILADDLGYGDLSCYGQRKFRTPHIDSLAAAGMRFTQCYAGTTVSAPSRSCLLTGTHSGHTAVRGNIELPPEGQYPLPEGAAALFLNFKKAGYATGVFGKWGLGFVGTTGEPARQGVDRFYGFNCQLLAHSYYPDHLWSDSLRVELADNTDAIPYGQGSYAPDLIHAQALDFIDTAAPDGPFFLFYPTTIPHAELIVPQDSIIDRFRGLYPETPYVGTDSGKSFRKGGYCSQAYPRATFAAMVARLDRYVGELVQKLRDKGLYDNTVIIFASDNGPHREGGADPVFFDSNGIYRGYKRDLYEGGIRVPMIVAWPGHVAAGAETDFMCAFWDLPATFGELLGGRPAGGDGISLLPLLENRAGQREHDHLYFGFMEKNGREAVRRGPWKLLHLDIRTDNPRYELYNIDADPSERHDVLDEHPAIAAELKTLMRQAYTPDPAWPLFGDRAVQ